MNPQLRNALVSTALAGLSVWVAINLAQGDYFVPALVTTIALGFAISRLSRLDIDAVFVGLVIIGYLIGCRGFAQLSLVPGLPLLPAEAALSLAVSWRIIRIAFEKRLPWSGDAMDWVLLVWLILGTARVIFDVPRHGFLAVRDYAIVYYALLYFIVRHMSRDASARRYLLGCVVVGVAGLTIVFPLVELFPDFFRRQLVLRQVPLIYYKDDIVQTFFAAGGVLLFHLAHGRWGFVAKPLAAAIFVAALVSDVRAAFVGGIVALVALAATGHWRFAALQMGLAMLGLGLLGVAGLGLGNARAERELENISSRIATITQIDTLQVRQTNKGYKVDNNRFRLVWWRTVATDVWNKNPVFGLGFGHDLSATFLREYDQELGEEFVARSPHSVAVSALGRLGFAGLGVWLAFGVVFVQRAWRGLGQGDCKAAGLWGALIVVATSSLFGVVLEGPMGAVPFWVLLGLAASHSAQTTPEAESPANSGS